MEPEELATGSGWSVCIPGAFPVGRGGAFGELVQSGREGRGLQGVHRPGAGIGIWKDQLLLV